jgi:hypothetical protein
MFNLNQVSKRLKLQKLKAKITSNSEMFINEAIEIALNIQYYWDSSDLETKLKLHKTVFPKGLIHYPFNKDYLTRNVNNFLAESLYFQGFCKGVKQKKPIRNDWLFLSSGDRNIQTCFAV